MCLHVNQKAHMACHLNLIVKVTTVKEFSRSQAVMHTAKVVLSRKSARDVTTKWYGLYRAAVAMILNIPKVYLLIHHLKLDVLYIFAPVDKDFLLTSASCGPCITV